MSAIDEQDHALAGASHSTNCRICIRGVLDPRWADYFGEFKLAEVDEAVEGSTVLIGFLPDASALLGLLTYLNQFGMTLFAVEWESPEREP